MFSRFRGAVVFAPVLAAVGRLVLSEGHVPLSTREKLIEGYDLRFMEIATKELEALHFVAAGLPPSPTNWFSDPHDQVGTRLHHERLCAGAGTIVGSVFDVLPQVASCHANGLLSLYYCPAELRR